MAIEGTLDLFQLPEILQIISQQGKTGILTVQGDTDIVAISFERGRIVAADALNQTLEEALGEVLAGQGLVAPQDFSRVAAEHRAGRGRLMDLLVERRLVERSQILEALRLHVDRLLAELLRWQSGEFKFYGGEEVSYEEGFRPISVEELLIRSVEEAAGEGHPTIPDSRSLYEPVPDGREVRVRAEGEEGGHSGDGALTVSPAERELLQQMAGGFTVPALVKKTGLEEYRVRYTLHRLLELGLVRRRVSVVPLPEVALPPPSRSAPVESERALDAPILLPPPPPRAELLRWTGMTQAWVGRLMALAPLAVLVVCLSRDALRIPLPLPWQGALRADLERELFASAHRRLDRAAKIHFLTEGHFPDTLGQLVARRLVGSSDLDDPMGRRLLWSTRGGIYDLAPEVGGEVAVELGVTEGATGNFLLDPEFLSLARSSDRKPLILLD